MLWTADSLAARPGWRLIVETAIDVAHDGGGLSFDELVWTLEHAGWNALLRAAFTLLLPLQCAG